MAVPALDEIDEVEHDEEGRWNVDVGPIAGPGWLLRSCGTGGGGGGYPRGADRGPGR